MVPSDLAGGYLVMANSKEINVQICTFHIYFLKTDLSQNMLVIYRFCLQSLPLFTITFPPPQKRNAYPSSSSISPQDNFRKPCFYESRVRNSEGYNSLFHPGSKLLAKLCAFICLSADLRIDIQKSDACHEMCTNMFILIEKEKWNQTWIWQKAEMIWLDALTI